MLGSLFTQSDRHVNPCVRLLVSKSSSQMDSCHWLQAVFTNRSSVHWLMHMISTLPPCAPSTRDIVSERWLVMHWGSSQSMCLYVCQGGLCWPFAFLLGCHHLRVNTGRWANPALQRDQSTCLRCPVLHLDDEMPCLFECRHPALQLCRDRFRATAHLPGVPHRLRDFMVPASRMPAQWCRVVHFVAPCMSVVDRCYQHCGTDVPVVHDSRVRALPQDRMMNVFELTSRICLIALYLPHPMTSRMNRMMLSLRLLSFLVFIDGASGVVDNGDSVCSRHAFTTSRLLCSYRLQHGHSVDCCPC